MRRIIHSIRRIAIGRSTKQLSFCDYRKQGLAYSLTTSTSDTSLPEKAHVIVIGGGIIGTSVAYHLAKLGVEDVLLLEQHRLTSGTTWHAAGLINTFGSMSSTSTWMRQYTKDLYKHILPEETGLSTGWKEIGFIELACDQDRLEAYRRTAAFNRYCGVQVQEITPEEVKDRFPLCDISTVLAGFYVESDGRANPTDATMAFARGARQNGVTVREGISVTGVKTTLSSGAFLPSIAGVTLADGSCIQADKVVNCAGMWARQFAEACGVHSIPNQAAEHYYLITEPMEGVDPNWPVIEDASRYVYVRPEGQGLMLGLFEGKGESWKGEGIPNDFHFGEIEPDWDRMAPYIEKAMELVPAVQHVGIKKLFCGPESFTPDNAPIIGESKEFRNYFVACGLNSLGILTGGGVGHILAHWVKDGCAPNNVDVTGIDAVRFHRYQNNKEYREKRVGEALGNTYRVHYPNHQPKTCRGAKQSALHDCLKRRNAYFKDVGGWESPMWYAPEGVLPKVERESFGRESWFDYWAAEHKSCRNDVALFDMSFMTKILVSGNDAGTFLNRLSTANVNGPSGRITYTQWLTEKGFMAADLTIIKIDENNFMVVATDNMHNQVINHMQKRLTRTDHIFLTDVTARFAQINVQGPKSRDLLQGLTDKDLHSLAFRDVQEIDIGLARAMCARITYVGELGYELFVPVEQARQVYHQIVQAGDAHDLRHAGLKALGSLRLVSTIAYDLN
ncbi:sarcosine dehydrogenase [Fistulifera solaris]|uniref:Sarcosine dehydrogenase n=1 Tax=Fistulifera solaris TaxID=1519565 RepID=A0A1Z5JDZ4_FISSO|nr:sarcosine dehydrogenase [Fistulifera solaris]|eukprot:GAX12215.1 sarcosine dehydrogenase [Fistulifera solaris]